MSEITSKALTSKTKSLNSKRVSFGCFENNSFRRGKKARERFNRQTQTPNFPLVDKSSNTPHDKETQCINYFQETRDKILESKPYITYEEFIRNRNERIICIQKYVRRYLAQNKLIKLKKERDMINLENEKLMKTINFEKLRSCLRQRIEASKLKWDDLSELYAQIMNWVKREKTLIFRAAENETIKQKLLLEIFFKEMECLHYIEKEKIARRENFEKSKKVQIIIKASEPIILKQTNCKNIEIENDDTYLARKFRKFYFELTENDGNKESRLKKLKNIEEFLQSFEVPEITHEILTLIDQECNLIKFDIPNSSLEGLKKRIEYLFLEFSLLSEFNPAVIKVTNKKNKSQRPLLKCRICGQMKYQNEFKTAIFKSFEQCSSCTMRKDLTHSEQSLVPFKRMLENIRQEELHYGGKENYAGLIQPKAIFTLVQNIWQGRSCLSDNRQISSLRLIRWDRNEEWSPWNCVLLTQSEAESHGSINIDLESVYSEQFIKNIKYRHLQAKFIFKDLELLNTLLKEGKTFKNNLSKLFPPAISTDEIKGNGSKMKTMLSNYLQEPISDLVWTK